MALSTHTVLAVPSLCLALALGPGLGAQSNLKAYEAFDYGVSGANTALLDDMNGGAGWNGSWVGVNDLIELGSWWPLDGNTGDAGPLGSTGTLVQGLYLLDVPVPWSNFSLNLQQNGYVELTPHHGKYKNLMRGTIAAWIKTLSRSNQVVVAGAIRNGNFEDCALRLIGGNLSFDVRGLLRSGNRIVGSRSLDDGLWHHVAVTVDGGGIATLYVDGQVDGSGHQGFFGHLIGMDGFWIGRFVSGNISRDEFFGQIDEVAIWGTALSQADIQNLANVPPAFVSGPRTPLGPNLVTDSLATTSLPNSAFGTHRLKSVGNRLSDATGNRAVRRLSNQIDLSANQTYYTSCLMRRSDQSGTTGFEVQFSDKDDVHARFGWDAGGSWIAGLDNTSTSPIRMLDKTTYFVVFKIVSSSSSPDQAFFKVFAPNETVPPDDSQLSGLGGGSTNWTVIGSLDSISGALDQIWMYPRGTRSTVEVDEIRMGVTWESVTHLGYGAGCLGAVIGKTNRPALGSSNFSVDLSGASPNASALMHLGNSRTFWFGNPLPFDLAFLGGTNCFVLTSLTLSAGRTTNGTGRASVTIPVPNLATLYGLAVYAQWSAVDTSGINPLPLSFSDGLEILFER